MTKSVKINYGCGSTTPTTPAEDKYVNGFTINDRTLTIVRNDGQTFSVELPPDADTDTNTTVTNMTLAEDGTLTLYQSDGTTYAVSLPEDVNTFLTSATYNHNTGILSLHRNDGGVVTVNLSELKDSNHYVNAGELTVNNRLKLTRTDGGVVEIDLTPLTLDDYVTTAQLAGTDLVLTRKEGGQMRVDLSPLIPAAAGDRFLSNVEYNNQTKQITFTVSGGSTPDTQFTINVADLLPVTVRKALTGTGTTTNPIDVLVSSSVRNLTLINPNNELLTTVTVASGITGTGTVDSPLKLHVSPLAGNLLTIDENGVMVKLYRHDVFGGMGTQQNPLTLKIHPDNVSNVFATEQGLKVVFPSTPVTPDGPCLRNLIYTTVLNDTFYFFDGSSLPSVWINQTHSGSVVVASQNMAIGSDTDMLAEGSYLDVVIAQDGITVWVQPTGLTNNKPDMIQLTKSATVILVSDGAGGKKWIKV